MNISGAPEDRIIIQITLLLGKRHWPIEVSLADRANMEHRIILGRTALQRHRMAVLADRSFLAGEPGAKLKSKPEEKLQRKKKVTPTSTVTDVCE